MQAYQINELERLTGVKAHTIRIWEKRYSLITPSRTDTNRRFYNDDQVRKLLNVATLLSKGHKISKIAAYTESEMAGYVQDESINKPKEDNCTRYINDLLKYMLVFDQPNFEQVFTAALHEYGVYETMLNVIYPFLHKTGVLWSVNKAIPVHEHFASCIIRQKLMAITDSLPVAPPGAKKFLIFLPPSEWHEIGLLFANYIIRSNGYETTYLGQNVPIENVLKIAKNMRPAFMVLFYIVTRPESEIDRQINELAGKNPNTHLLIARKAEAMENKSPWKNVTYLFNVNQLMDFV